MSYFRTGVQKVSKYVRNMNHSSDNNVVHVGNDERKSANMMYSVGVCHEYIAIKQPILPFSTYFTSIFEVETSSSTISTFIG